MTNGDRIRNMTDEELEQLLSEVWEGAIGTGDCCRTIAAAGQMIYCKGDGNCKDCLLIWLKEQEEE